MKIVSLDDEAVESDMRGVTSQLFINFFEGLRHIPGVTAVAALEGMLIAFANVVPQYSTVDEAQKYMTYYMNCLPVIAAKQREEIEKTCEGNA